MVDRAPPAPLPGGEGTLGQPPSADEVAPCSAAVPVTAGAAAGRDEAGLDRVLTVPNLLSVGRLLLLGLFCWLLFGPNERVWAAILLAVTGATDFLDGVIARRFHQ
ncbi:MAG: CDP-alcohol phosphatidyltransferase family protein, partial [Acidimicrobiales bacterium]